MSDGDWKKSERKFYLYCSTLISFSTTFVQVFLAAGSNTNYSFSAALINLSLLGIGFLSVALTQFFNKQTVSVIISTFIVFFSLVANLTLVIVLKA